MGRPSQVCCSASPLCVLGSLIPGLWQCPHAAPTRMHARTSFDSRSLRKDRSQVIRVHLSQVTQKSVTGSLLDWLHCGSHKATTTLRQAGGCGSGCSLGFARSRRCIPPGSLEAGSENHAQVWGSPVRSVGLWDEDGLCKDEELLQNHAQNYL